MILSTPSPLPNRARCDLDRYLHLRAEPHQGPLFSAPSLLTSHLSQFSSLLRQVPGLLQSVEEIGAGGPRQAQLTQSQMGGALRAASPSSGAYGARGLHAASAIMESGGLPCRPRVGIPLTSPAQSRPPSSRRSLFLGVEGRRRGEGVPQFTARRSHTRRLPSWGLVAEIQLLRPDQIQYASHLQDLFDGFGAVWPSKVR
ncbi:hypothetical protein NDU88_002518 [Pleurodeles waltl]|uniref:Uncharacterized protein n=1 Tax=Pleurodeles waltl TaxID=8319 RepID=A0AAV7M682_PLEWA|nr:hypothetical protein NDU88_002518 [Pleurodeles waltl]